MSHIILDEALMSSLPQAEASFIRSLVKMVSKDEKKLKDLFEYIGGLMKEKNWSDFRTLSDDLKFQACLEYISIGLLGGEINKNELLKVVR